LIYALLAGTYSYWLLGKIVIWFAGFMVTRYQGWGFVLFATTLGFLFRQPIRKSLLPITSRVQPWLSKGAVLPKRARLGLGLAALLAVLFLWRLELKVSGPFTVLPLHNADVRATVEGIIEEIYADEGDWVEQTAPVARLSDRDYGAELRNIRAEIGAKQAQLNLLMAGPRREGTDMVRT